MRINPPVFPLDLSAFADALRKGHGRAVQQIAEQGADGLQALIIEACVTSLAYDPQLEAERAPWLFSIVDRAQLQTQLLQTITVLENRPAPDNYHDSVLRSTILRELAASGSDEARHLLYASLAIVANSSSVVGAYEIIALDGLEGLIYVARQAGKWLQADPDYWVDDYFITLFDGSSEGESGLVALQREAAVDADIASYLAGVNETADRHSNSSARSRNMAFTGEEVVAYVKNTPQAPCNWLKVWGKQADSEQRAVVFAALLASEEPEHVKRLLLCFVKPGIPQFDNRLLRWIDHPDKRVQWAAVTALGSQSHPELRQAAQHLIAAGEVASGVALLVNNYHEGDFSWCAEYLVVRDDADEMHSIVRTVLNLCEAHPGHEALDCLLYVYERSPCSSCRTRAVKALINTDIAPTWVLDECVFDAEPDTRAFVSAQRTVLP